MVLPSPYALAALGFYGEGATAFGRLAARGRALPPLAADPAVVAVAGLFTDGGVTAAALLLR
ncbi:hypothetical protein ABZ154_14035 [Streptomyces sp. NPDC006261]|uniref:hypothetical protein n=1 Tax=Streptomyces sp. NPDC006261 TaxID=3156739 RepID=UPI00339E124C